MTLGQRISEYRKKLGISQEELGARLGLTRSGVNHRLQRILQLGERILEERGIDSLL